MTTQRTRVLVTGADQHQGLAVIRGLGIAGVDVIAAGLHDDSMGFYSRYVVDRVTYRAPRVDPDGFVEDIVAAVRRSRADLVMPVVESTLAPLLARRSTVEVLAPLAAPPAGTAAYALDKRAMLELASSCDVPIPLSAEGATVDALLARARRLSPPYVIKPRGHDSPIAIPGERDFKVQYAANRDELRHILLPLADQAEKLLVQEFVPGIGRCVACVWRRGAPVAMLAYERERELPITGGVSVLRRSIALDAELSALTTKLLTAIGWHGVAMVEYKYDRRTQRYTLMEINGRFQASTALCIDAGMNLPHLAMSVHLDRQTAAIQTYRENVVERWLRGDFAALVGTLRSPGQAGIVARLAAFFRVLGPFLSDFARAPFYDEFRFSDPKPGLAEAWSMVRVAASATASKVAWLIRPSRKSAAIPDAAVPMPRLSSPAPAVVVVGAAIDGLNAIETVDAVAVSTSAPLTRLPASTAAHRSMRA